MKWFLLLLSFSVFAQTHTERFLEEFMKQRQKMMEEIRKAFEDDEMIIDNFFEDDEFMQEFRKGNFGSLRGFRGTGEDFTIEERTTDKGETAIYITPKDQNVNLDIKTEDNRIVIKSETKVKEENQGQYGSAQVFSARSYTRSIGIPFGYKASDPVAEGNSIKIVLVPTSKSENGRIPIGRSGSDQTL